MIHLIGESKHTSGIVLPHKLAKISEEERSTRPNSRFNREWAPMGANKRGLNKIQLDL